MQRQLPAANKLDLHLVSQAGLPVCSHLTKCVQIQSCMHVITNIGNMRWLRGSAMVATAASRTGGMLIRLIIISLLFQALTIVDQQMRCCSAQLRRRCAASGCVSEKIQRLVREIQSWRCRCPHVSRTHRLCGPSFMCSLQFNL